MLNTINFHATLNLSHSPLAFCPLKNFVDFCCNYSPSFVNIHMEASLRSKFLFRGTINHVSVFRVLAFLAFVDCVTLGSAFRCCLEVDIYDLLFPQVTTCRFLFAGTRATSIRRPYLTGRWRLTSAASKEGELHVIACMYRKLKLSTELGIIFAVKLVRNRHLEALDNKQLSCVIDRPFN